jgi:hypothetical protein
MVGSELKDCTQSCTGCPFALSLGKGTGTFAHKLLQFSHSQKHTVCP